MSATKASTDAGSVAVTVHRFAVLLQAGLAPARAWEQLAAAGDETAAATVGDDLPSTLAARGETWGAVAVAWQVAATVGAPLADSLRGIADALRDAEQAQSDVTVALAEPAATARLIAWLPLLAIVLVAAFGFDVAGIIAQPVGLGCLGAGLLLMVAARRWTAALVRGAQPAPGVPGLACDVVAIALSGGASIDRALTVCEAAGCAAARGEAAGVLALSRASGAPAVELLRAEAVDARRAARTEGRLRAARLSSRLLVPLGVCTLPAFLFLGVAPMLLSVLAATPLDL